MYIYNIYILYIYIYIYIYKSNDRINARNEKCMQEHFF